MPTPPPVISRRRRRWSESVLAKNSSSLDAQLLKGAVAVERRARRRCPGSGQVRSGRQPRVCRSPVCFGPSVCRREATHPQPRPRFKRCCESTRARAPRSVEIAKLQLSTGNAAASVRTAEEAAKTQPRNLAARLTLARSLLANKDLDRAAREIDELQKTNADVAAVQTLAGSLALLRNDPVNCAQRLSTRDRARCRARSTRWRDSSRSTSRPTTPPRRSRGSRIA